MCSQPRHVLQKQDHRHDDETISGCKGWWGRYAWAEHRTAVPQDPVTVAVVTTHLSKPNKRAMPREEEGPHEPQVTAAQRPPQLHCNRRALWRGALAGCAHVCMQGSLHFLQLCWEPRIS